tara:strand:+ start:880 stop:1071 length:192 start_codon:yes stop_codon:yes gene_type:complete
MPDTDYIVSAVALTIVALLGVHIWLTLVMMGRVERLQKWVAKVMGKFNKHDNADATSKAATRP